MIAVFVCTKVNAVYPYLGVISHSAFRTSMGDEEVVYSRLETSRHTQVSVAH